MKLRAILKEITDRQSREMITGIADILRDVKDRANREAIAKRMMRKFDLEGVKYNAQEFARLSNVAIPPLNTNQNQVHDVVPNETEVQRIAAENRLKEIGETTAKPYPLTKIDESVYYVTWGFKTDSGTEYKIVIGKNFRGEDPDGDSEEERDENELEFLVSFGVVSRGTVDFEAEFKDVKNLFRVMATVIKAVKITIEEEADESGIPVTRIIMEPTKKDKGDTRRANLYMRFIQKQMPAGAKISTREGGSVIVVDIPGELNEGWKENLLFVGAMALSSLGLKSVAQSAPQPDKVTKGIEVSDSREEIEREFYAAMVAAAKEMKERGLEGNLSPEEFQALKEASRYFESLRDGQIPAKPSRLAQVAIDHLYKVMAKAPAAEVSRLADLGQGIRTIN